MNEELRQELLAMQQDDQAMRSRSALDPKLWDEEVDRRHTARLKEIIREHGYPGKSLVGTDGAGAAWLLAQHADLDRGFQRDFLALLKEAVRSGEADARNLAYLTDRVRLAGGESQLYGTQYTRDGEYVVLRPVEDPAGLDARRHSVGLSGVAQYLVMALALDTVQRTYQIRHPNVRLGETEPGNWRAWVSGRDMSVRVDIAWDPARQGCRVVGDPVREG